MRDETFPNPDPVFEDDSGEHAGALRRALYLWERQPPRPSRTLEEDFPTANSRVRPRETEAQADSLAQTEIPMSARADVKIEERLKSHASRLSALERIIPGDRRLDPPRFSLMMLNAFIGRAFTDGAALARLPGLFSISDRIEAELSDLELEYPAALEVLTAEPDPTPASLRDEMRRLFSDLTILQKAQQRQVVTSLAALHTAIATLRAELPDRESQAHTSHPKAAEAAAPDNTFARIDDLARPLIDAERLVDPRPVLAAARAAASRAHMEMTNPTPGSTPVADGPAIRQRPYRSVLLGSAFIGILMILFGRDAVQFLSSSPLHNGLARP